jgi:hypothetical protein
MICHQIFSSMTAYKRNSTNTTKLARMTFALWSGLKLILCNQPLLRNIKKLLELRSKKINRKKSSLVKVVTTKPKTFPKTT